MEPRVFYCQGADAHVWSDPDDASKCCNGYERAVRIERDAEGNVALVYYWKAVAPPVVGIAGGVTPPAAGMLPSEPRRSAGDPSRASPAPSGPNAAVPDPLRHVAYFEALGQSDAGTPEW